MRIPSAVADTVGRYRSLDMEYPALRVVGRGLFLAVMLMVAFLYVFVRATDIIAGDNEVLIPTTSMGSDVDLGALARGAFTRTSAAVVSVVGALTLIVSAMLTAHAMRLGTRRALLGPDAERPALLSWRTAALALLLSCGVLATWLLTLATSIRRSAWAVLLGRDLSPASVDVGKALAVALSLLIIGGGALLWMRLVLHRIPRVGLAAAAIVAIVVVAANFFLLYTYIGALINPAVSGGIVLVLTLLLWVNLVVRVYLGSLCWVGSRIPSQQARVEGGAT